MVSAAVKRNQQGRIIAFVVTSHCESRVCAAVSLLVTNTINSIEEFTDEPFSCEINSDVGGFVKFSLIEDSPLDDANLLLESMFLGLKAVQLKHEEEIELFYD